MPVLDVLFDIIAPHHCFLCGAEGRLVCRSCMPDAICPVPSRCYRCRRVTVDYAVCSACSKTGSSLRNVWLVADYSTVAKQVVYGLKFGRKLAAASIIVSYMDTRLPYFADDFIISHVPTANNRVRQRGYDQSQLIACRLARSRKLTHSSLLFRIGSTRQVGASRQQRLSQLEKAFMVKNPKDVRGRNIILVDDIVTTGASLEAAAKALKAAGAKTVCAIVFAQKV